MANAQPKYDKDKDASNGDPKQTERIPPPKPSKPQYEATWYEALDRRTIRQAIMTQLLSEIADEIINSGAKVTKRDPETEEVLDKGDLGPRYNKGEFPLLHALIKDPELEFNKRRNKLFVVDNPDKAVRQPFGSVNLVVFRDAMAISKNLEDIDPEEVAKRVVIRAGRSGNYAKDRNFAGCK